jgi:alpha-tubulin suppressor-like RCC1 family protein
VAVDMTGVLAGKTVVAVSAGQYHSVALCSDGTLAAWGINYFGQLGSDSTNSSPTPVSVKTDTGALAGKTVVSVSAGGGTRWRCAATAPWRLGDIITMANWAMI